MTGRGDVKEVEICCIPARRERVHGVWSEYPLIQYQYLARTLHSTITLLAVLNVKHYQYFSASHQYFFTQYQYLARYCTNTTLHRDNSLHSHLYL